MDDYFERLSRKTQKYSCSLMSNTKWREVFQCLSGTGVRIRITTVWDDRPSTWQTLVNLTVKGDHIADGCIEGGPLMYQEILKLHIDRAEQVRSPQTGAVAASYERSEGVKEKLMKLGQLPLECVQGEILIYGYK